MTKRWQIIVGLLVVLCAVFCVATPVLAATGDGVFTNAAENILCKVLHKEFGAMLTAIAGILAIVAAAAGSFKGAWALVFVSVGCYVADALVNLLFSSVSC